MQSMAVGKARLPRRDGAGPRDDGSERAARLRSSWPSAIQSSIPHRLPSAAPVIRAVRPERWQGRVTISGDIHRDHRQGTPNQLPVRHTTFPEGRATTEVKREKKNHYPYTTHTKHTHTADIHPPSPVAYSILQLRGRGDPALDLALSLTCRLPPVRPPLPGRLQLSLLPPVPRHTLHAACCAADFPTLEPALPFRGAANDLLFGL
ncbi:hypothetical protein CSOJ01_04941 [Colletotrichum sojae]|uniref:Uncharacterized protein n=1 Tax=Colletotrichum sojae TaxID=2175907 RepID=A0A8H6JGR3_9PEZI|nr:hypothetical protein CSOJ01_04941 [Colletotrichum sojae]